MGRIPGVTSMLRACPPCIHTHVSPNMSRLMEIVIVGVQLPFCVVIGLRPICPTRSAATSADPKTDAYSRIHPVLRNYAHTRIYSGHRTPMVGPRLAN